MWTQQGQFGPSREFEVNFDSKKEVSETEKVNSTKDNSSLKEATVLYFFSSYDMPGIKIYNQSHKIDIETKDQNIDVIFQSREMVMWDAKVNLPNGATNTTFFEADIPVYTFIVSQEELESIIRQLQERNADGMGIVKLTVKNMYDEKEELRFYKEFYEKENGIIKTDEFVYKEENMPKKVSDQLLERYDNNSEEKSKPSDEMLFDPSKSFIVNNNLSNQDSKEFLTPLDNSQSNYLESTELDNNLNNMEKTKQLTKEELNGMKNFLNGINTSEIYNNGNNNETGSIGIY